MTRLAALLSAAALLAIGAGFGPFVSNNKDVEEARALLGEGKYPEAVEILKRVEADAPEVHFARGVALLSQEKPEIAQDATTSLDQAYRLIAEQMALLAGHDAETDARRAELTDLKHRVAFSRGLLAAQKQDWAAAVGEFRRCLEIDPQDQDARWNLELAYFKLHPPCKLRDDDHEPDSNAGDAKPFDPKKAEKRVLCPADEDWYALELPAGTVVQIGIKGKVETPDDEDDTRTVTASLYAPSAPDAPFKSVELKGGEGALGVRRLPEAGTWRLRLDGPGRAELAYDLQIAVVPPCPADDEAEENDTPETATAVQDGEKPGLKACPGDADWFEVKIPAKEARTITVKHNPDEGPLIARLAGSDNIPLDPGSPAVTVPAAETEQVVKVLVTTVGEAENLYALEVKKPDDGGGKDQDKNQDKDQDKNKQDQDKNKQDQDKNKQDQGDQNAQNSPPSGPGSQPPQVMNQVEAQKLIDELDKNKQNPQLQKLLKSITTVPRMEDY